MTPTKQDREAAAKIFEAAFGPCNYAAEMRAGLHDSDPNLAILCEHRLTAQAELIEALERIASWEMPDTGQFWDDLDGTKSDRPMSYGACYGSSGERDVIRRIASQALAAVKGEG